VTHTRRIAQALRRRIGDGEWDIGEQIPTLDELCVQYQASGPTVRRAQEQLKVEGLLRSEQGRGVFVAALPVAANDRVETALQAIDDAMDLLASARRALAAT
jgi:DNA-binding GntR family transcriptional regulator